MLGAVPNRKEYQRLWKRLDIDGDGKITLKEMLQIAEEDWIKLKKESEQQKDGINSNTAFMKGIDWFTEIVFFYGILFGICWWEFKKYNKSQKNQNDRLASLEYNNERLQLTLQDVVE